ncbi:MAG: 50S ribosomal protein L18 [Planctomycetota bacterium]|nr:50S ribosomal protein L18 [Planctomycetota bacterium]
MNPNKAKALSRKARHERVRKKVFGTPERPRLNVFRSLKHFYCQLVDDTNGRTLLTLSTLSPEARGALKNTGNREAAGTLGKLLAEKAKGIGVTAVVFDRGGYKYHGRVKEFAEAARKGGLAF